MTTPTHKLVTLTFTVPIEHDAVQTIIFCRDALTDCNFVQVDNPTFERLGTTPEAQARIDRTVR
jgi:hypothetical protein